MIIRSQDKTTITTDLNIEIYSPSYANEYIIQNNSVGHIGTYYSKEKAIKVLDMITKHYDKVMDARYWNNEYQENVFQMPEDCEV